MSVFANSSDLEEGDVALILRDDGTFQLVSAIPAEARDHTIASRHVEHMLLILGLYMTATDDEKLVELTRLGASEAAQAMVARELPGLH